jgi:putative membrane protein
VSFIAHWIVTALALALASYVIPGVRIDSWVALAAASLVLGIVNAIIRPVLVIITLPVTILTLGLFYFVVNGIVFGLAAYLVPGFSVDSLFAAILGALVVGLTSWFVGAMIKR